MSLSHLKFCLTPKQMTVWQNSGKMSRKYSLTFLCKYMNKFENNIENYVVPDLYLRKYEENNIQEEECPEEMSCFRGQFMPFQPRPPMEQPKLCLWLYMNKDELIPYLKLTSKRKMRKIIESKIGPKPKGASRLILIEFMLNATLFCKKMEFNLQQTGALLSMYYLTHKHFTDHMYVCAEDLYRHFKTFLTHHCLLFPPTNMKIFNMDECKQIMLHFCTLYLRHLPLIRLLTLPNFGFELNYELEPEVKLGKKDKKLDKKKQDKGKKI